MLSLRRLSIADNRLDTSLLSIYFQALIDLMILPILLASNLFHKLDKYPSLSIFNLSFSSILSSLSLTLPDDRALTLYSFLTS